MTEKTKPVSIVIVEPCKVEGEHLAVGAVLLDQDAAFAVELAGAGKARLATEADLKAAAKAKKGGQAE